MLKKLINELLRIFCQSSPSFSTKHITNITSFISTHRFKYLLKFIRLQRIHFMLIKTFKILVLIINFFRSRHWILIQKPDISKILQSICFSITANRSFHITKKGLICREEIHNGMPVFKCNFHIVNN